jgi:hypothetical protein
VVPLALVLSVSALVKPIVVPVLLVRLIPSLAPVEETAPSNEIVPAVWLATLIAVALPVCVMLPL